MTRRRPLPVADAAVQLGCSARQVERLIARGAPVVRRGSRGRGRSTLLDVGAVAAWVRTHAVNSVDHETGTPEVLVPNNCPADSLLVLANDVPTLVADAVYATFVAVDGPHKRAVAGVLAGAAYSVTVALLDRIRVDAAGVAELDSLPEKINQLRRIFGD